MITNSKENDLLFWKIVSNDILSILIEKYK